MYQRPTFALLASALLASAAPAHSNDIESTYRLDFFGLNCEVCEDDLKVKFEKLATVREAQVDMLSLKACLKPRGSAAPTKQELGRILTEAGLSLVKLEKTTKG